MMFKRQNLFFHVAIALALIIFMMGCEESVKIANNRPSIDSFTKSTCYIEKGGSVHFKVSATDADGDRLFYSWSATGGTFSEISTDKTEATWTAPDEPGSYDITVKVTDEIEDNFATLSVDVCEYFPSAIQGDTTISYYGYKYILKKTSRMRVEQGVTLTIGPGVTVVVNSKYGGIDVHGRLVVQGEKDSEVSFIPNFCREDGLWKGLWGGIYFSGGGSGDLSYTLVSASEDGISINSSSGSVSLDHCTLYYGSNYGLYVSSVSELVVQNCKIWENDEGVYIKGGNVEVTNSSIRYNTKNGLNISGGLVSVTGCKIANNRFNGVLISSGATPVIHNCSIFYNGEDFENCYAVKLEDYEAADTVHAESNFWGQGNDTEAKISELIYDGHDNQEIKGYVSFVPFLTSPPSSDYPVIVPGLLRPGRGERSWER